MTGLRIPIRLLALLPLLFTAACALGDREVTLAYPPKQDAASTQAAVPTGSKGHVQISGVADTRGERERIGFVQNTYGMETADVIALNDVAEWVRHGLETELRAAGYDVDNSGAAPQPGVPSVAGVIARTFTTAYFTYRAEILFAATVTKDGNTILDKSYNGNSNTGMSTTAAGWAFADTLTLALQDALRQFVADLSRLDP